ncbi:MAG: guanylate kinase [Gemmatimonadetes bacterium]|nr:guanylate kinase [Gemmatimonadota bacterium]
MTNFLLVLSAPSGGGKTTLAKALLAARPDTAYSVSATTRAPRSGEAHGKDYYFLTRLEFERRVAAGAFLEWAEYAGNLYGTLRSEVERIFAEGKHAVLDIEVQGARKVRASFPEGVHVFVLPPSATVLVERLQGRGDLPPEVTRRRLQTAVEELGAVGEYDYVVINDRLELAAAQLAAVLDAEGLRPRRRGLAELVYTMRRELAIAAGTELVME